MKGKFASAYQQYKPDGQGHPDFTAYADHRINIDYINYSKDDFKVISLLNMPQRIEDLQPKIPNEYYPSDHLRIEARLELL